MMFLIFIFHVNDAKGICAVIDLVALALQVVCMVEGMDFFTHYS